MNVRRQNWILALIALVALAGVACGDDDDDKNDGTNTGEEDASTPAKSKDAATTNDADKSSDTGSMAVADASNDGMIVQNEDAADEGGPRFNLPTLDGEGPFTAVTVLETGPGNVNTLFHPEELAADDTPNPIIVWGNGGGTAPDWYAMLPFLATHGFVVIAPNNEFVSGPELRAALDWIIEQNDDQSSNFYNKLDTEHVGAMGYSNGSLAVYDMLDAEDPPDLVTTVHVSGGTWEDQPMDPVLKEPGPTAYLCDDTPLDQGGTKENCDRDFEVVEVPCFYGSLLGAIHVQVPFEPFMGRIARAATAWFQWHLMGDGSKESVFLGDDCEMCQDSYWSVQRKNWEDWQ